MSFEEYIASISPEGQRQYRLLRPLLDPVIQYLLDSRVSEIFVLSERDIRYRIQGSDHRSAGPYFSDEDLQALIQQIGTFNQRQIGFLSDRGQHPVLEGSLPCGSRCSGALKGVNVDSHCLTIRKHHKSMLTPKDLVDFGSITQEALDWLQERILVYDESILISGSTDSGKTTFLNVISNFLSDDHRILVCEDTPELQINKPHVVRFQTAPAAGVSFVELLDLCMRQTGDHVVFGEIRAGQQVDGRMAGSPAYPFAMALNSGHLASMTTIHANGREEALNKFVDYCFFSGVPGVPAEMFRKMVGSAFQVVIQLTKDRKNGKKLCTSISTCKGWDEAHQRFQVADVFTRDEEGQLKGRFDAQREGW